jgi:hypothetical protein
MRVVEGLREGLSLAQTCQDTPKITERTECRAQGESEINGLLLRVPLLWQMLKGTERLLKVSQRLTVSRVC